MISVKFANNNAQFFMTLKNRVNQYFVENKIKQTGNYKLYIKTALLVLALITTYVWLVFFTPGILMSLVLCSALGIEFAAIGFNVMHDGSHGSYSSKSWLNNVMGYSLELMGGCSYLWKVKHNVAHHSFTNIEGMDEDIDILPLIRLHLGQKKHWYHRFQHIYSVLLYGLTYVMWIYFNDFKKYFTGKIKTTPIPPFPLKDHIVFWATKLTYFALFMIIPIWQVGFLYTLLGYALLVFTCGVLIAITFQLAHVHEDAEFITPLVGEPTTIENEWAIHQIVTTANFATKQKWHAWFWGGLNYQIEHHLFPRISHIHYPAISKIVKKTCAEFNVAYHEFPTVVSAIHSHFVHLRNLGLAR